MKLTNYEFKARVEDPEVFEKKLAALHPTFLGEDHQVDTYFNVPKGRLKLRVGNIENGLIYYERENRRSARQSNILLFQYSGNDALNQILVKVFGVKAVVEKWRKIYLIANTKFHFDRVRELGTFLEVEAIGDSTEVPIEKLKEQCEAYFSYFGLSESSYVPQSYSDLIVEKAGYLANSIPSQ